MEKRRVKAEASEALGPKGRMQIRRVMTRQADIDGEGEVLRQRSTADTGIV